MQHKKKSKAAAYLIIGAGFALMAHHAITAHRVFDITDPLGHDWLGLAVVAGYMVYDSYVEDS